MKSALGNQVFGHENRRNRVWSRDDNISLEPPHSDFHRHRIQNKCCSYKHFTLFFYFAAQSPDACAINRSEIKACFFLLVMGMSTKGLHPYFRISKFQQLYLSLHHLILFLCTNSLNCIVKVHKI